jgi:hypothetical protein
VRAYSRIGGRAPGVLSAERGREAVQGRRSAGGGVCQRRLEQRMAAALPAAAALLSFERGARRGGTWALGPPPGTLCRRLLPRRRGPHSPATAAAGPRRVARLP